MYSIFKREISHTSLVGKAPGFSASHLVDPNNESPSPVGNPRYGPEALTHYMSQNNVFVDVWDGDSFLHLGVCTVPVKTILRQGRAGVTTDEDVDIIWTEVHSFRNLMSSFPMKISPLCHALLQ